VVRRARPDAPDPDDRTVQNPLNGLTGRGFGLGSASPVQTSRSRAWKPTDSESDGIDGPIRIAGLSRL
jgi:hypothetical protein